MTLHRCAPLLLFLAALAAGPAPAAPPGVVASIHPLHSLVAGVMDGVGSPHLVVRGFGSPHTYQMRPSDARALENARLVFWIGGDLETFLSRSLDALADRTRVVTVSELEGLHLLASGRTGHDDLADARGAGHAPAEGSGHADPHLWLDPVNATVIVAEIARRLAVADPANAPRYRANAEAVIRRLELLDAELAVSLEPVSGQPYVVLHDAYRYLERRYRLNAVGAVSTGPERMPSARHVKSLRSLIARAGVRCVFGEPQIDSALLGALVEGTAVKIGELDALGAAFEPGPRAYFAMMQANRDALVECLTR